MRSYTLVNPNARASANSHRPRTRSSPSIQSPSRTCYRSSSNISTASSSSSSSSGSMVNSTTTSPILKPKIIRSNDQVRSKFLSKIGIVDVSTSANASSTSFAYLPSSSPPAHSRDLQSIPRYREPLKYNRQEERLRHERKSTPVFSPVWLSTPNNSIIDAFASLKGEVDNDWSNGNYDVSWTRKNKSNERKKKISFEESVHVVPIPMRSEYSDRIRNRLWNNAVEIHENAARNALEFAAENWDWRTVYHEEDMYICCITGELIHPAHYQSRSQPLPILGRSD